MVVRQGMGLAVVGLGIGALAALLATRLLATLLYEMTPADPLTLAAVSILMMGVSAVACWIPGRRAIRTDPSSVLREE